MYYSSHIMMCQCLQFIRGERMCLVITFTVFFWIVCDSFLAVYTLYTINFLFVFNKNIYISSYDKLLYINKEPY